MPAQRGNQSLPDIDATAEEIDLGTLEPRMSKVVEASFAATTSLEIECGNTTNQTTVAVSEGAGVRSQICGD